jgi:exopolyphosphatase/pppGpp-phosphohydrolase
MSEEVKKSSGVNLEVISEFEEARLTLLGAKLNAPKDIPCIGQNSYPARAY